MLTYVNLGKGQDVTERSDLLASIADTVKDYRAEEIAEPTPGHVDRWIRQFDGDVQVPMLRELDYVFRYNYISKSRMQQLLGNIASSASCDSWRARHILSVQRQGGSQATLREMFGVALKERCGSSIHYQGSSDGPFVYLDDVIFTGNRVIQDLSAWISRDAPQGAQLYVFVIAAYQSGKYWIEANNSLKSLKSRKQIRVVIRHFESFEFESRLTYRNQSDVLWPVAGVYDDESFSPRTPQSRVSNVFSSEQGRQLLEREFLNAGIRIRGFAQNPSPQLKPLGFSRFEPGFGSLFVTFRNCPNNCPLALWYGDPSSYPDSHPLGRWYPLFPRKGYSE